MQYKNDILYNDIEYIRVCVAYNRPNNLILAPSPPLSLYLDYQENFYIKISIYSPACTANINTKIFRICNIKL